MNEAFAFLTSEPWAIQADWLHFLAAMALRAPALAPEKHLTGRAEVDTFFAGPTARPVANGTGRAVVSNGVALIPITGPIFPRANMMTEMSGATSCSALQRDLAAAQEDDAVDAILLAVDSPGGAVSGVAAAADAIHAARGGKPLAAHVTGTGASAAYWLASQADRLTVDRTAMVGSIGVVVAMPKQMTPDSSGNMAIEIVSSNAPDKRPDPTSPDGFMKIRDTLDALEAQFIGDVARGRGVSVDKVKSDFGHGGTKVGVDAVNSRMANGVSTLEGAMAHLARVANASRSRQQAGR